jgi:CRP-like cAMP-binding protein
LDEAGEIVFLEGDPGRALFVVVEGTVEITQATRRGALPGVTLGVSLRESALILDRPLC